MTLGHWSMPPVSLRTNFMDPKALASFFYGAACQSNLLCSAARMKMTDAPGQRTLLQLREWQPLPKSKQLETPCRKLSNVCRRERAHMRLLRQLEFAFETTAALTSILSVRERRTTKSPGHLIGSSHDVDLESKAREILYELDAN